MNRQIVSVGIAGIIIGVIIGFFAARAVDGRGPSMAVEESESLPDNHPGEDVMEQVLAFTRQAESEPENAEIRVQLGNTFYDMGRYDVSARWYREALELDPSQPLVSTDLGTSLLFMGRTDEAISQYRYTLSLEPGHPQTLQNLGVAFFSLEQYREAIELWQRLLEENPDYSEASAIEDQIASAEKMLDARESEEN